MTPPEPARQPSDRPKHPAVAAGLLMFGVVLFLLLVAVVDVLR